MRNIWKRWLTKPKKPKYYEPVIRACKEKNSMSAKVSMLRSGEITLEPQFGESMLVSLKQLEDMLIDKNRLHTFEQIEAITFEPGKGITIRIGDNGE